MSHSRASKPMSPPSTGRYSSRATQRQSRSDNSRSSTPRSSSYREQSAKQSVKQIVQPPIKKLVRWICKKGPAPGTGTHTRRRKSGAEDQARGLGSSYKVLWAGGSVATLAALAIVPGQVRPDTVTQSKCQEVIKSGAEISRGQLSGLVAIPVGTSETAVRQVINEPYCLLPVADGRRAKAENASSGNAAAQESSTIIKAVDAGADAVSTEDSRQAYPLAFDPEAWVIVSYEQGEYAGYDFVFRH